MDKGYTVEINSQFCKKCGICYTICPRQYLVHGEDGAPEFNTDEKCIGCRDCEFHCPDFAVKVKKA